MKTTPQPVPPARQTATIPQILAEAHAHWRAGQASQAGMLCRQVLAAHPEQADALHLLGLIAHAGGELDLAISYLKEACKASGAPAAYASNLAEMHRQKGQLKEGEEAARRALAQEPGLPGAWNNLGIILQEAGAYQESLACLEKFLQLKPQDAEGYNNLGNTCMRLGRLADARRHWQKALTLRPGYAQPHSNLANLLSELGDFDEAAKHARHAIDIDPHLADAYINLANIENARQRPDAALQWLNKILAFAPAHAGALTALAQLLQKQDRQEEALAAANRALAAAPKNAEAHNARGAALQALGRVEEALEAFGHAAVLPGSAAEQALVNRALLHMEQGEHAQTQEAFARAIAQFPNSAVVLYNYADFITFMPGDPLIMRMEEMLERGDEISQSAQVMLRFALGKAHLDAGDPARAFHHLDVGNRLKRASFTYAAETATRLLGGIAATFSVPMLKAGQGYGAVSARPVFVLGMPRSGTTLTEQILAAHPAVFGAGELRHVQGIVDGLGGFPGVMDDLPPQMLRHLGQQYLDKIAPLAPGARHVVDKLPFNFAYAGFIRLILPGARIIHVRRNAVDTCLSCYSKLFTGEQLFAYDQTELGTFYRDYEKLAAHWRDVLPATHYLEVEYEAIIGDVEGQARRMLAFLELEWSPACVDFHLARRAVRTASVNQVRQPVYKHSAGRWKAYEPYLQPLLAALGAA